VFGKLLRRYHEHRQLDQLFQPIQVAEMFLRDSEGVKRGDESRFLALLNSVIGDTGIIFQLSP
jgi:hypothetical protein